LTMMRRVVGVRHTPRVHDLDDDMTALVMHSCRHLLPPDDMRGRVDARRSEVTLPVIRGLSAFGDDQADAGALALFCPGCEGCVPSRYKVWFRPAESGPHV
jgi:hypothetical protein